MLEGREPLTSRSLNCSISSSASPQSPRSLYPIFRDKHASPTVGGSAEHTPKAKRAKSSPASEHKGDSKRQRMTLNDDDSSHRIDTRSIADFFTLSVPRRSSLAVRASKLPVVESIPLGASAWRRPRSRLGFPRPQQARRTSFLSSLAVPGDASPQLSTITIPSLHSPDGFERDFDPALVLAFNSSAKLFSAPEAKQLGWTRLLALAGEEGCVKIVNVDDAEGSGTWWRAHDNAVFDLKWTANDSQILSASADQTLRIHSVADGAPQLRATLRGHTSTIKTAVFLDPSRGCGEPSGDIIASGGRDGNINIYDLRCQGTVPVEADSSLRRSSRTRSASGASTGHILPVMTLRQPHNIASSRRGGDPRSVSRTITSLVALQSIPGVLASGGTFDGIVKLWDVRCPEATSSLRPKSTAYGSLPDPTTFGPGASLRGRSVNALCEQPMNGDLYALCGDSKIHVLRPAAAKQGWAEPAEAILPQTFVHPDLLIKAFYIRMSLSPDCRYLACGSQDGGVMTWDTSVASSEVVATRLKIPSSDHATEMPEVVAVDWGKDMMAASSDDCLTRVWRASSA